MSMTPSEKIQKARTWLSEKAFPLWIKNGIDPLNGSFIESLRAAAAN